MTVDQVLTIYDAVIVHMKTTYCAFKTDDVRLLFEEALWAAEATEEQHKNNGSEG
jgi:hypothetical protein